MELVRIPKLPASERWRSTCFYRAAAFLHLTTTLNIMKDYPSSDLAFERFSVDSLSRHQRHRHRVIVTPYSSMSNHLSCRFCIPTNHCQDHKVLAVLESSLLTLIRRLSELTATSLSPCSYNAVQFATPGTSFMLSSTERSIITSLLVFCFGPHSINNLGHGCDQLHSVRLPPATSITKPPWPS